jgi:hypothetical protein
MKEDASLTLGVIDGAGSGSLEDLFDLIAQGLHPLCESAPDTDHAIFVEPTDIGLAEPGRFRDVNCGHERLDRDCRRTVPEAVPATDFPWRS